MPRDHGIATRLRAEGLRVVEVAGWRDRGSASFNPRGFVWHHTAGPLRGNAPSLTVCIYGRPGVPGPLCNVFQARDGTVYVVAAGRANHAGSGGWQGLSGNSSVYGLEIENTGYNTGPLAEPWRLDQLAVAARVARAVSPGPVSLMCHHKEWTRRKIDMHTVTGGAIRAQVTAMRAGVAPPPPPPPARPPASVEALTQEADMLLAINRVGYYAVVGDIPIELTQDEFDTARANSRGVQLLWLDERPGREMTRNLLEKLAAARNAGGL